LKKVTKSERKTTIREKFKEPVSPCMLNFGLRKYFSTAVRERFAQKKIISGKPGVRRLTLLITGAADVERRR